LRQARKTEKSVDADYNPGSDHDPSHVLYYIILYFLLQLDWQPIYM